MTPLALARAIAALGVAFLLGSLPWALWIGQWARGVDVRAHGSGNLGATNVYRTLGPRLGWTVFALDLSKSAAAVFAADAIGGDTFPGGRAVARAAGALCAVLGHVFSPFAGWKGGKGVAAALGAMVAVAPVASLTAFGVFVVGLVASRRISVGSILAAIALPTLLWVAPFAYADGPRPAWARRWRRSSSCATCRTCDASPQAPSPRSRSRTARGRSGREHRDPGRRVRMRAGRRIVGDDARRCTSQRSGDRCGCGMSTPPT